MDIQVCNYALRTEDRRAAFVRRTGGLSRISSIQDVVDWGLCIGCGVCAYACERGAVRLINIHSVGIRPQIEAPCGAGCDCIHLCPGAGVDVSSTGQHTPKSEPDHEYGEALEIWSGFATDPAIRYKASSGGLLTALSSYCLDREGFGFILHTGKDPAKPWQNATVQSASRDELLERAGSRYGPSSPCDGLGLIEHSQTPAVFVGKPCDVAAVQAARKNRPALDKNLGLVLTFFCAGTPSTQGTLDLVSALRADKDNLVDLRYRGEGWPGRFTAVWDRWKQQNSMSYQESWGKLTGYRPLRCNLCPDGLGRVADISCGDAWDQYDAALPNPGISIVLVRSRRGQEILRRAAAAGYVTLFPASPSAVLAAQTHLLRRRRELFGRLLALRLLGIPTPNFRGFSLLRGWLKLPFSGKLRTLAGTLRRAVRRGW